jgi:FtsP/CotA-like multicopper oxidase with cupredoxin domain
MPSTYNVMDYGTADYGSGTEPAAAAHGGHGHAGGRGRSVAELVGPQAGTPDARFTLTAQHATVRLASGRTVEALTFDGRVPGPELRVREGDLVEVTLVNRDVEEGVSVHWHGVDVPNAEDGVSGVTQDAVPPGGRHTYRFRADQVGTFWYHTHQSSADEVRKGLYGAFVIAPREDPPAGALDLALVAHTTDGSPTLNALDEVGRRAVAPGTPVRLRLVNANNTPERLVLQGTPFRVVAIDGTDLHGPTPLRDVALQLAGGGRYDVAFTMPRSPVRLGIAGAEAALVLSRDGAGDLAPAEPGPDFDPAAYGTPAPTPFDASSRFDRRFRFDIGRKPGFLDGRPGMQWSINGGIYPDVPVFVVRRGDLVQVTISNDTKSVHPMHLHGHHMLVLGRDGRPATGSPWWSDTLNLEPGESYDVAFRADNPGLWMDHCHNLRHAAEGLTMHLAYEGVWTPFTVGGATHNHPE